MLQYLSNNAHGLLAADVRALGEGMVFGGGNAGAQALGSALAALECGAVDAALVVAYDSALELEALVELAARGWATPDRLPDVKPPYARRANGFVPGEAAAAVVLQRPSTAGSRALALLEAADGADGQPGQPRACTLRSVAARVARHDPILDGAARAIEILDMEERGALSSVLGSEARVVAIASALGEVGCAKALLQAIVLPALLRGGQLPPIARLREVEAGPLAPVTAVTPTLATSAVGLTACAPGLVGAIRVSLP
jgi:malonyl-ACP decarboxylase